MFTKIITYLLLSDISIVLSTCIEDKTLVTTTGGPIRGKLVNSLGVTYYSYQGIPYAENPTGPLRFKPPEPKSPWTEVRNATKEGPVCPQAEGDYVKSQMSEDCLFANVYVPANETRPMAALVIIPGGEFKSLSGNADLVCGPELLLQHGVIVVTVNYRLGALGFLSLDIEEASGNAGLKDILLALKWTNANIESFGGDRNKITLGGTSSGAASVHYLLMTKKSSGLFKQAILFSGSALSYRFFARHPKQNALALKQQLGIMTQDTNENLQQLQSIDAFEIVQAQTDMGKNDTRKGFRPFAPFVPCVEIQHADALITRDPRQIIEAGIPQNVPILAGLNNNEGLKMYPTIRDNYKTLQNLIENFELCIPSDIEYPYGSDESQDLVRKIQEFYFKGEELSNNTILEYIDLVTDTMFAYNIDHWIKLHKERNDSNNLYYYTLGFDRELNWFKITNKVDLPGMAHGDQLGYTFTTKATRDKLSNLDPKTQDMVSMWTTCVTNFVKFGNPTPQPGKKVWIESGRQRNHVYLNEGLRNVDHAPRPDSQRFWQNVYDEYYNYVKNGGRLTCKVVP